MDKAELNRQIIRLASIRLFEICAQESKNNILNNNVKTSVDAELSDLRLQYKNAGENND